VVQVYEKAQRAYIPTIKDCNRQPITELIEKVKSLNFYYSSVFSVKNNIPYIQYTNSQNPSPLILNLLEKEE
jgi:hypothetical protein